MAGNRFVEVRKFRRITSHDIAFCYHSEQRQYGTLKHFNFEPPTTVKNINLPSDMADIYQLSCLVNKQMNK